MKTRMIVGMFVAVAASAILPVSGATTGAENLVPRSEFNKYRLVYDVSLQNTVGHGGYKNSAVPYYVDRAHEVTKGGFNRVAYFFETVDKDGVHNWVWVSLDAFTDDPGKLGVPTGRTGAFFQQKVKNLRIWSNNETIVHRDGALVDEGNIEFWPNSYGGATKLGLPGASDSAFDFDDTAGTSTHGSMQIHDYKAGCTLFGINNWENGGMNMGVGTNTADGAPDWTMVDTASFGYTRAKLQVYVMDDGADVTPPEFLSAATRRAGTEIVLSFSKPIAADQDFASAIAVGGTTMRGANRDPDDGSKVIVYLVDAVSGTVSVTATGVKDASPRGNAMAEPATRTVEGTDLPPQIAANVSAAARAGYDLVYAYELPVEGMFENVPANMAMGRTYCRKTARTDCPRSIDRVAYYMEIVSLSGATNWVWASCDAWTQDLARLDFPSSAATSTETTAIANLDVESNVVGAPTGTGLADGTVRNSYGSSNADSTMRVMSGTTPVFAINNFRSYHSWVWYGIGSNTSGTGTADWLNMSDATVKNTRIRRLYVLVRPKAATIAAPAPAALQEKVEEAKDYSLLCKMNLPLKGLLNTEPVWSAATETDNRALYAGKGIRRVAYFLSLVKGDGTEQWAWASFDAHTQDLAQMLIPTNYNIITRVANLNVRSNVGSVQTGDGIQTGVIKFYARAPNVNSLTLGLPTGLTGKYDVDDGPPAGNNWGSFEVSNWAVPQPVLSVQGFTRNATSNWSVGIGTMDSSTIGDFGVSSQNGQDLCWIFPCNAGTYRSRTLYVLVQEGAAPSGPEYLYTIAETGGRRACVLFNSAVTDALLDPAAYAVYPAAAIKSVERSRLDAREVILTFTEPLQAGVSYTMSAPGAANGITAEPRKTMNRTFRVPDETLPAALGAANVSEVGDYELVYKFAIPSAGSSCGTYGAPYVLDKTRFKDDFSFDRVAYALHLVGTNGVEQWVWTSMDAFTSDASQLGIPCERRKPSWQCVVTNLVVRHGVSGGAAPDLTDGDYATGNIEFFPGNYGQTNGANIPGASAGIYDFGDQPSSQQGSQYCSLQVHSYLSGQTAIAVNYLGGGAGWSACTVPHLGIGNCPTTNPGYVGPDWTTWSNQNAPKFSTRDLYIFVRPTANGLADVPAFAVAPEDAKVHLYDPLTLVAYAPTAETYQWMKDGEPIVGATGTTLDISTARSGTATYSVTATDAAGHSTTASARIKVISGGTTVIFR